MSTFAMSRRKFISVAGLTLATAGCVSKSGSGSSTHESLADIKGVTVTHLVTPDFVPAAREAAKEYSSRYGAHVEFNIAPTEQLFQKLTTELGAGSTAVDTVNISPWWLGTFGPHLLPLEQYLNNKDVVAKDFNIDDYDPRILKEYGTFRGKLVAFPSRSDHMMLFYRRDLFEDEKEKKRYKSKHGEALQVPKTWEQFNRVAEFFTRPDEDLYGLAVMGKRTHQIGAEWINRLFAFGGVYFDENGRPAVGSAASVKATQHLVDCGRDFAPPGYLQYDSPEAYTSFWQGKSVMVEGWPASCIDGASDESKSRIAGKWDGASMPGGPGGAHACAGGWMHGALASSKHKLAAYKWIEVLSTLKYEKARWQTAREFPARSSAYHSEWLTKRLPKDFPQNFLTSAVKSRQPPNQHSADADLMVKVNVEVSAALAGVKSSREAMTACEKYWIESLKRAGRL